MAEPLGDSGAWIEGPRDPSLPLVVLLHGLGGTLTDLTAPLAARPGTGFDRTATFPPYVDAGWWPLPPSLPFNAFFLDPPLTSVRSWQAALTAAGITSVVYSQAGPTLASDVAQLSALALGPLSDGQALGSRDVVLLGHSRGGVLARAFVAGAATSPALAAFRERIRAVITVHSPHLGSGVANLAGTVSGLVSQALTAFAALGLPPPGPLLDLGALAGNPAVAELAIGSATLAGIAAAEPVPGVAYHTFGGTSTVFSRLWASVFTPDSVIPILLPPLPIPLFHHGTTPVVIGAPFDASSFAPLVLGLPIPVVTELAVAVSLLAAATPELAHGTGDLFVADARSHLPFSVTRATNPLNHAEALWDQTLQAQVIGILLRMRAPGVSGRAATSIRPFPASLTPRPHVVTARDAVTGLPLPSGTVTVRDSFGSVLLTAGLGAPFTAGFRGRRMIQVADDGTRDEVVVQPTVAVELPAPYGDVGVDLGLDP